MQVMAGCGCHFPALPNLVSCFPPFILSRVLIPNNIEQKFRFNQIRESVSGHCLTSIGVSMVADMSFMTEYDDVLATVARTAEMLSILKNSQEFPASELPDLREPLRRIRVDGLYLVEDELLALRVTLNLIELTTSFFASSDEDAFPLLKELCADMFPYPLLVQQIDRVLDLHGVVRDTASPELADLRREIRSQEAQAARRLNSILKQAQADGIVDADANVSIRDGQAVIPVPVANKRSLGGIVLDESSSGRTAFVQPAEVVAINSRLRELHSLERREVIRILKDLSANIRPAAPDLIHSLEILGHVDFVRAKALYALDIDACMPNVENRQGLYLSAARHPLLMLQLRDKGKQIVPLNIELEGPGSRILVISGPNAGGKSVCLQTVGLIQYMLQCGLLVPVAEGSSMGIFHNLFIDIGDDQSIENDLSTYSSHLTQMKNFVRAADKRTLLLIDEFGTGTEPMLGGAIAEAVLAELNRLGAFGVVTTHYTNLKHFASQTPGLVNGAMTFDVQKIEPLFSLHIGQPGSSFAFEIARKIGLPERILDEAKAKMGQENADYDKNLRQIVRDKHYWEQKRQNVKENDKKLADVLQRYNDMLEGVKAERREILAQAREQAKELLAEGNRKIENTIRLIKESQAEKERTRSAKKDFDEFRKKTEADTTDDSHLEIDRKMQQIRQRQQRQKERAEKRGEAPVEAPQPAPVADLSPLQVGDFVVIDGVQDRIGQIIELKGKNATVSIGNMSSNLKLERLKRASKNQASRQLSEQRIRVNFSSVTETVRQKKLNFSPEIDVRGMRGDEAVERIAQFVDEALLCEASHLRILHGKGNGILRQLIRDYLKGLPFVSSAQDENVQFGGAGITVVDLK